MSSTTAADRAVQLVSEGNIDFQVPAVEPQADGGAIYTIIVPNTLVRNGFRGELGLTIGGPGRRTKLGSCLVRELNILKGVEATTISQAPNLLILYISPDAYARMLEAPGIGLNQVRHLPERICVMIQTIILQNYGAGQKLRHYIRGLV